MINERCVAMEATESDKMKDPVEENTTELIANTRGQAEHAKLATTKASSSEHVSQQASTINEEKA